MNALARKFIIYSLTGILQISWGATIIEAAPGDRYFRYDRHYNGNHLGRSREQDREWLALERQYGERVYVEIDRYKQEMQQRRYEKGRGRQEQARERHYRRLYDIWQWRQREHKKDYENRLRQENERHEWEIQRRQDESSRERQDRLRRERQRHDRELHDMRERREKEQQREREHDDRLRNENERHEREMWRRQHESETEWHERQDRERERHDRELRDITALLIGIAIGTSGRQ
ncbi:MAG: hypothetical protein E6X17_18130 [Sporomusaceae bacterium]|nr:hypothetical protein [Sporomusaceae bacterium]